MEETQGVYIDGPVKTNCYGCKLGEAIDEAGYCLVRFIDPCVLRQAPRYAEDLGCAHKAMQLPINITIGGLSFDMAKYQQVIRSVEEPKTPGGQPLAG